MKTINERVEAIKSVQSVLEFGSSITQPNAMQNAHYKDKLQAVWWYNVVSKQFLYSTAAKSHWSPQHFPELQNIGESWVRGRIYKYNGENFIMMYSDDFPTGRIPGSVVHDIYQKATSYFKEPISDFVDQEGYTLLGGV